MELQTLKSGSISDWEHTPNLTPRGYELKKDELYVLNGDTLIKAYHLLISQRFSALQMVAKSPPTAIAEIEEYLSLVKYINMTLYHILHSLPLVNILQMQEEARQKAEASVKKADEKKVVDKQHGLTLKEMLDKFHLTDGGTRDEIPPKKSDEGEPEDGKTN